MAPAVSVALPCMLARSNWSPRLCEARSMPRMISEKNSPNRSGSTTPIVFDAAHRQAARARMRHVIEALGRSEDALPGDVVDIAVPVHRARRRGDRDRSLARDIPDRRCGHSRSPCVPDAARASLAGECNRFHNASQYKRRRSASVVMPPALPAMCAAVRTRGRRRRTGGDARAAAARRPRPARASAHRRPAAR